MFLNQLNVHHILAPNPSCNYTIYVSMKLEGVHIVS